MAEPGFWDDHDKAQKVIDDTKAMKDKYDNFNELSQGLDDIKVAAELYQEDPEDDLMQQMVDES